MAAARFTTFSGTQDIALSTYNQSIPGRRTALSCQVGEAAGDVSRPAIHEEPKLKRGRPTHGWREFATREPVLWNMAALLAYKGAQYAAMSYSIGEDAEWLPPGQSLLYPSRIQTVLRANPGLHCILRAIERRKQYAHILVPKYTARLCRGGVRTRAAQTFWPPSIAVPRRMRVLRMQQHAPSLQPLVRNLCS